MMAFARKHIRFAAMTDEKLDWALREWSAVCAALICGAAIGIARKGGIHEPHGALFPLPGASMAGSGGQHLPHRFALLASHFHQQHERLADWWGEDWVQQDQHHDQTTLHFPGWAEVAGCWIVDDPQVLSQLSRLEGGIPLSPKELRDRYHYRQRPWLAVLSLRVWRWQTPYRLANSAMYGGCRSWISLQASLSCANALPALDDQQWRHRHAQIAAMLSPFPCVLHES